MKYRCPYCEGETLVIHKGGSATPSCPSCGGPLEALPVIEAQPIPPQPQSVRHFQPVPPSHNTGWTPIILGMIALMGSIIPCLGIFALPLAITGLTWSGIGWLTAASRKHANTSPFIVGGLINLLAICIVVGMCYWIFNSGRNARDETADSAAATIIAEAATEDEDIQSKMDRALHTGEWFRCSNGLQVRVLQSSNEEATGNIKAEKEPENNKANDASTSASVFSVKIALRNRSNKSIRYRDFLPAIDDSSDQGIARLFDEDGSSYSLVLKPEHTHAPFVLNGSPGYPAKSESSINPSKDYRHISPLFFEPIPDDLKKVYLELPLKNLGVSGSAIFEIDTSRGRRP